MTKKELQDIELNKLYSIEFSKEIGEKYQLRVKVEGNRFYNGEGYLISMDKPFSIFDKSKIALVWDKESNNINRVTDNHISFIDRDDIIFEYKKWAETLILNCTVKELKELDYSLDTFLKTIWCPEHPIEDYSTAKDLELEKYEKKLTQYKEKKIKYLTEWAKKNTNKKTIETAKGVAESIYEKYYEKKRD